MASTCATCGAELTFFSKLLGKKNCSSCGKEEQRARSAAEAEYEDTLDKLVGPDASIEEIAPRLSDLAKQAGLSGSKLEKLNESSLRWYLQKALEDDYLTEEEEQRMSAIAGALGIDQAAFDAKFDDMKPQLVVARVNDGRLPELPNPQIILKKNEVAHISANASLIKEVAVREYQGGYRGASFRIAKGVRYHVGGTRGRSVVVGTKLETEDVGILVATSKRAVFSGQRRTVEMPYSKLVNLNVFDDAIQFHLSNRKNPPMFQIDKGLGHVIAAVVNAACQEEVG